MTDPFCLLGRRAVVTGANSGIGRAIALGLARQGADVAVHGHGDRNGLASVRTEIEAIDRASMACEADFLDPAAPEALARRVTDEFGPVDILIANAAIEHRVSWQDATDEHFTRHFTVNFASRMALCRALVTSLADRGWGRVVANGGVMAARARGETVR